MPAPRRLRLKTYRLYGERNDRNFHKSMNALRARQKWVNRKSTKRIQPYGLSRCHHLSLRCAARPATRISTRSHHKCDVWTEAAGRTLRRMDKITQLEILARAFLGGLVERHGREHAAHILVPIDAFGDFDLRHALDRGGCVVRIMAIEFTCSVLSCL